MKKRLMTILLTLIATLCLAFAFAACDSGNSGNSGSGNSTTNNSGSGNGSTDNGGNVGEDPDENEDDLWTVERLYAEAQAKGFKGSLDDLIALFKGETGAQGPQGQKGETGAQGPKGETGKDGIGIKSVEVDENGHLKVTLTDGTVLDAGKVTGDETTADEGTEGIQYQKTKGENGEYTAVVVGLGTAWDTDIVIPSTYRGVKVTTIVDSAFDASKDARCANLTNITIPDSMTEIGESAFRGCRSLESVTLADGSKLESIGSNAFQNCSGLTGVYITDLSAWCKIEFGDVYANPLYYAHHLYVDSMELKELTIPNEITEIKPFAFFGCGELTSITIPDAVTSIGSSAFYGCDKLMGVYITDLSAWCKIDFVYSANPLSYAHHLYVDHVELKALTIPNGITEIKPYAFYGCSGLESVMIGSGVKSIEAYAFYGCSSLSSIGIPDSVTSIGSGAFSETAYYNDQSKWDPSGMLYIGNHLIKAKADTLSGSYSIRANIKTIADDAFSGCSGLTGIEIPDGVTSIGSSAFHGCSLLESIDIPDSVTSIGEWAFFGCNSLESIAIPDSVTSIGVRAFEECSKLMRVDIHDLSAWCKIDFGNIWSNPLCYAHHLYVDSMELKELTIPNEITEIKNNAFAGCSGLTSVTIHDGVNSIGERAFCECSGLKSIEIPDSVTSIDGYAFYGCSLLESVTIGSGVTEIGDYAFNGCGGLKNVYYKGTPSEWSGIQIGSYNSSLTNATRYYFSAQTPSAEQWQESENWWHYDADDETIVLWTKES